MSKKIIRKELVKFLENKGINVLASSTKRVKQSSEPELPTFEIEITLEDEKYRFDYFNDGSAYCVNLWDMSFTLDSQIKEYLINKNIQHYFY